MSQRDSGYARKELDLYETPEWVTEALITHIDQPELIWEPACGFGKMLDVLQRKTGAKVLATDISDGPEFDFLDLSSAEDAQRLVNPSEVIGEVRAIVTNPPYNLAEQFCEHALRLMEPKGGLVAMLLRTDFDHAKSRTHLFRDCPAFAKKLVLMKRIVWFVDDNGKPKASPSFNHCWMIWDWKHEGPPTIAYGP
jgi:hypothetical protein